MKFTDVLGKRKSATNEKHILVEMIILPPCVTPG